MRRLAMPALTTVAMLALTLSLGFWQVSRLHWKRELLAEIERGELTAPVRLFAGSKPFTRVFANGEFATGVARYGAEIRATSSGAVMGSHVVRVLRPAEGVPVVVDLGWAPIDWSVQTVPEIVRVEGYIRPRETAAWSSASDDLVGRRFFTLDPIVIAAALGVSPVAQFTLVALGTAQGYPAPATSLPRPPNDHLSYAITWFSLSAVLLVVFAVYVMQAMPRRLKS